MTKGAFCTCPGSRPSDKWHNWRVITRRGNYSAFNGGKFTPSAYSEFICANCGHIWRNRAAYIAHVPDLSKEEREAWNRGELKEFVMGQRLEEVYAELGRKGLEDFNSKQPTTAAPWEKSNIETMAKKKTDSVNTEALIDNELPEGISKETADKVKAELVKFSLPDAAIASLEKKYGALTCEVDGPEEEFEAVKAAYKDVREKRIAIDDTRQALNKDALYYQRQVNSEAKRLTALITPLELKLKTQYDKVNNAKEEAERKRKEAEEARKAARTAKLFSLGMTFDGSTYSLFGQAVDVAAVHSLEEEAYLGLMTNFERMKADADASAAEAARLKEEADAKAKADAEELARLKAENERLKSAQAPAAQPMADFVTKTIEEAETPVIINDPAEVAFAQPGAVFSGGGMRAGAAGTRGAFISTDKLAGKPEPVTVGETSADKVRRAIEKLESLYGHVQLTNAQLTTLNEVKSILADLLKTL